MREESQRKVQTERSLSARSRSADACLRHSQRLENKSKIAQQRDWQQVSNLMAASESRSRQASLSRAASIDRLNAKIESVDAMREAHFKRLSERDGKRADSVERARKLHDGAVQACSPQRVRDIKAEVVWRNQAIGASARDQLGYLREVRELNREREAERKRMLHDAVWLAATEGEGSYWPRSCWSDETTSQCQ